jgi:hypothetical protein
VKDIGLLTGEVLIVSGASHGIGTPDQVAVRLVSDAASVDTGAAIVIDRGKFGGMAESCA